MTLSTRRQQMFAQLTESRSSEEGEAPGRRAAEFDYRKAISDDIEDFLRKAKVFETNPLGWPSIDRNARLRALSDEIMRYIVG